MINLYKSCYDKTYRALAYHQTTLNGEQTRLAQRIMPIVQKVLLAFAGAIFCSSILINRNIGLPVVGGAVALLCYEVQKILGAIYPQKHDMANHSFTPGKWLNSELSYVGDVPVLTLREETPFGNGFVQGYLIKEQIEEYYFDWEGVPVDYGGYPDYRKLIEKLEIPQFIMEELEGVVAGYKKKGGTRPLTTEGLLISHLVYDRNHLGEKATALCTAMIDKNDAEGPILVYNRDAFLRGLSGKSSLVIKRHDQTMEVTVAGFIGSVSGINRHGLALAMNSSRGKTEDFQGIPSIFLNRILLENCASLADVHSELKKPNRMPLGPYHLSVVDKSSGEMFFIHQNYEGAKTQHIADHFFSAGIQDGKPLAMSNCRVQPSKTEKFDIVGGGVNGRRIQFVLEYLPKAKQESGTLCEALHKCLALRSVNRIFTYQTMAFIPRKNALSVRFDEAFAAEGPLHQVLMAAE